MTRVSDERALWLARHVLPHEPTLRAWLSRKRVVGLEVDDIVQETYARLISAESLEGVRNPKTYAYQTAYSVLLTHVRRAKVVSFHAMADVEELGAAAPDPTPEAQVADREELRRLAEAIAALPGKVQDVFRLRRVDGLSQREVAQRLGLAESTVEKHMARGFHLLMDRFGRGGTVRREASRSANEEVHRAHGAGDGPGD